MMLYFVGILRRMWGGESEISRRVGFCRNIAPRGRNRARVISQGDYAHDVVE